jgi:hypothetical protein
VAETAKNVKVAAEAPWAASKTITQARGAQPPAPAPAKAAPAKAAPAKAVPAKAVPAKAAPEKTMRLAQSPTSREKQVAMILQELAADIDSSPALMHLIRSRFAPETIEDEDLPAPGRKAAPRAPVAAPAAAKTAAKPTAQAAAKIKVAPRAAPEEPARRVYQTRAEQILQETLGTEDMEDWDDDDVEILEAIKNLKRLKQKAVSKTIQTELGAGTHLKVNKLDQVLENIETLNP